MGINTLTTPSAIRQTFLYSNQAIAKNDLIVNSETGYSFKAPSYVTISAANSNATMPSLFAPNTNYASQNFYGSSSATPFGKSCAQLGNGNIVYGLPGDPNSTPSSWANIQIRNYQTNVLIRQVIIGFDNGVNFVKVERLNATSFVVCWVGSNALYFDIYNNAGDPLLGQTVVQPVPAVGTEIGKLFNVQTLSNGDFVIVYRRSNNNVCFTRYNSSGVIQGSEVIVDAGNSGAECFGTLVLASGNFVITYQSTSNYQYRFAIFNSSGVQQLAPTVITSSNSSQYYQGGGFYDGACIQLSNGNIAFITPTTNAGNCVASVYTSTGTLVTRNIFETDTSFCLNRYRPGLCINATGFAAAVPGSSNLFLYTFDNLGNSILGRSTITSTIWSSNYSDYVGFILIPNGAAGYFLHYTSFQSNLGQFLTAFDQTGQNVGTSVTLLSLNSCSSINYQYCFLTADNNIVYNNRNDGTGGFRSGAYYIAKKSIFGVAIESASANSIYKVGQAGAYNLSDNYTGGAIDRTATAIAVTGAKGTIIGNVAVFV
jgi:hypothetical protein